MITESDYVSRPCLPNPSAERTSGAMGKKADKTYGETVAAQSMGSSSNAQTVF